MGQLARFGVVGLFGFVVDVGVFNLLRATLLEPSVVHEGPFIAKVISTCLAIATNYVGNRYWTFGATRRSQVAREGLEFVLVSVGGMLITLACLWVSHYALGFTSVLADNISGNVIGLVSAPCSGSRSTGRGCSTRAGRCRCAPPTRPWRRPPISRSTSGA